MRGFATTVDERLMASTTTKHRAVVVDGADQFDIGAWRVTWLPEAAFDRNQAITAMTLVEYVSAGVTSADHPKWPFVKSWARELGLDADEVVRMILAPTDDEVVTEIRKAYVRWRFTQAQHDRIMPLAAVLADEGFRALGVSRAQWERVVDRLAGTDGVNIHAEADQKRLADKDHAAAVTLGGTARHTIQYTAEYTLAVEGEQLLTDEELRDRKARAAEAVQVRLAEQARQRQDLAAALDHVRRHGTVRLPDLSADQADHVLAVLRAVQNDEDTPAERRDVLHPLVDLLKRAVTEAHHRDRD